QAYIDEAKEKNLRMSGWNLFLQYAMANPLTYLGLAGYWSMNRTGSGTVLDLSKNGNTGTLKPSWPSDSPQYVVSKNKKMLNALDFDGLNDYVDCGTSQSLNFIDALTVECWFNIKDFSPTWQHFVGRVPTLQHIRIRYQLVIRMNNVWFYIGNGVTGVRVEASNLSPNRYYHVAGVYEKDVKHEIYLNGVLKGANYPPRRTLISGGSNSFRIGGVPYYLDGAVDEVRAYNRALSAAEILNLYNLFK
ncbi:hypothetical protein LCGC14_2260240, partial [marine sediment metagenome]